MTARRLVFTPAPVDGQYVAQTETGHYVITHVDLAHPQTHTSPELKWELETPADVHHYLDTREEAEEKANAIEQARRTLLPDCTCGSDSRTPGPQHLGRCAITQAEDHRARGGQW